MKKIDKIVQKIKKFFGFKEKSIGIGNNKVGSMSIRKTSMGFGRK